jgi:flagellar hook-length control protein FliK
MTPQPAASAPKEIAPQRVAPPMPAIGTAFDRLLSIGLAPSPQAKGTGATDGPQPAARAKGKNGTDTANAVVAVPTPPPQLLPAISAATSAGETQIAAPAAPARKAAAAPDPATLAAKSADASDDTAGGGTKLPPGAAALEARIVAGAPNYVSQPSTALAGLWHHLGASPASPTAPGQPGATASSASTPPSAAAAAEAQADAATKDAAAPIKDIPVPAHAATATDPTQAPVVAGKSPDAGASADASGAVAIALPNAADAPLAATQAAAANPTPSPAQIPSAWDQVAINLGQAARNNTDRIEIQLKPASLGAIAVKLDLTHDGRVSAVISADRSDTLNLLRQHSDSLAQSLRDAGLQTDSGSLSFNLRGDPQSFAQGQTPASVGSGSSHADDLAAAPSPAIDLARYRQHAGALDIEV